MKRILVTGVMMMLAFALFTIGSAEQVPDAEGLWNGTWISEDYTYPLSAERVSGNRNISPL